MGEDTWNGHAPSDEERGGRLIEMLDTAQTPRRAAPTTMVIFGAAGDLTKRLLIPALYNLVRANLLPDGFSLIGIARSSTSTQDFRQSLRQTLEDFVAHRAGGDHSEGLDQKAWKWLSERIEYTVGDLNDSSTYEKLRQQLEKSKERAGSANCLFYLAVAPSLFSPIIHHLAEAGLTLEEGADHRRVVIEKPFGTDFESAKQLNADILSVLQEKQVYRIDHYLGKETVQNVMVFRFANGIFESLWNRDHIDNIQITVAETVGVERRARFYEQTGALRDMVPNHLFQLLTLIAMEPPNTFEANAVRNEKVKVLDAVHLLTETETLQDSVRGQYVAGVMDGGPVKGYREEQDVSPSSTVETDVALKFMIDNWRWAGVPFYLRTGKRLARRTSFVVVQFKRAPLAMFRETTVERMRANRLLLYLQPEEGLSLQLGAKIPGPILRVGDVRMDFNYRDYFEAEPNTGYETLIYDCMLGDATLFQRADSVESAWRVVQPILDAWAAHPDANFEFYAAGSDGPKSAHQLLARDGRNWFPLT
jgi:glucose-6-phosphate 1-dehydrogenase